MKLLRRHFLRLAAASATLPAMPSILRADTYPSRTITAIVPFAAGGPADIFARLIAGSIQSILGQSVVIENVGGAAGSTGAGRVARAEGDGYTLLITPGFSTHVINPVIYKLDYDVVADFEPVGLLVFLPNMMVSRADIPAQDLKGLIGWLKDNPDKALQGTSGVGSVGHLAGLLFQKQTGTRYQFVPYRGLGPALQDLVAGRVDLMIDVPLNSLPYVRDGKLRAYAVLAQHRLALAPDIPTSAEAGVSGAEVPNWYCMFAPKGTPKEIIGKLNAACVQALATPELQNRITNLGLDPVPRDQLTPEALGARQRADAAKWTPIIKEAGIKPE